MTASAQPAADKLSMTTPVADVPVPSSVLGADVRITRDGVETKGDFVIEGHYEGRITCRTLTVSPTGTVVGEVVAQTVKIYGGLNGSAAADTVLLFKGGSLTGEVKCRSFGAQPDTTVKARIEAERGVAAMDSGSDIYRASAPAPANIGREAVMEQEEGDFRFPAVGKLAVHGG